MTITLPLQPKEEERLVAAAEAKGMSTTGLVHEAVAMILAETPSFEQKPSPDSRPIWEVMIENMKDVSADEFARLPKDGAGEVDHYLYGHSKRNNEHRFRGHIFWIAFTNVQDEAHLRARAYAQSAKLDLIYTTEEVLTEYLNYFAGWGGNLRRKAALNVHSILANPAVRVVAQSSRSFHAGLALYGARPDKGYSLTDCISMSTMRSESITDALTNDVHFEQEGFPSHVQREGTVAVKPSFLIAHDTLC